MQDVLAREHTNKQNRLLIISLVLLPVIVFFISLCMGRYWVSPGTVLNILSSYLMPMTPDWTEVEQSVVINIRLPRLMLAMLVGAGLAISGAGFQGLFANPLVSPHILGVSAGAGFGAALGILLSGQVGTVQALALFFGIIAVIATWTISRLKSGTPIFMLVLSGVIVGAFFQALISLIKYIADPEDKLPAIVYWLMGSMSGASYDDLLIGAPLIIGGIVVLILLRWRINILSLEEEEARSLGINIQQTRWVVIAASTVITAASVCLCGIVGWVGLVIPHIARMIVGPDHKRLLPACVSIGSFYLLIIDDIARTATAAEIPLSILTAIIGAPFFAYLLRKTGGKW